METRKHLAAEKKRCNSHNCAQAVVCTYCDLVGLPEQTALDIADASALVQLISDSEAGMVSYKVAVSFFPHRDAEDFGVSYDAYFEKEVYNAPGRRSKKREAAFLASLRSEIDAIAAEHDAAVDWEHPLNEARMG